MTLAFSMRDARRAPWAMLSLAVAVIALILLTGCDEHWVEKLAPSEIAFARHCFSLLQRRDFAAIEAISGADLRTAGFRERLGAMADLIPDEEPISSAAVSVNTSTTNGYTTATISMVYRFRSGALQLDIGTEGRDDATTLTWISLGPTDARPSAGFMPLFAAIPAGVLALALLGAVIYRRRIQKQEKLRTTPEERARRDRWASAIDDAGRREPWLYRLIGIRRIALNSTLSPELCRERLTHSIDRESLLFRLSEPQRNTFEGRVGKSGFRIARKRSVIFTDKYQTFLYGRIVPEATGALIRCWIGPQRLVLGLAGGFLLFGWVMFPFVGLGQDSFRPFDLVFLLPPVFLTLAIGFGFAFNRRRTIVDGAYLMDFVSETLAASEAPPSQSASVERVVRR